MDYSQYYHKTTGRYEDRRTPEPRDNTCPQA